MPVEAEPEAGEVRLVELRDELAAAIEAALSECPLDAAQAGIGERLGDHVLDLPVGPDEDGRTTTQGESPEEPREVGVRVGLADGLDELDHRLHE